MKVIITKINEAYLRIDADNSILYEIRDKFSFHPPNYKFSPKFKSRIWDGYIRLFNINNKTLPYGLIEELISFCNEYNYEFELRNIDDIYIKQNIDEKELVEFCTYLNIYSNKEKRVVEIHDYQFKAIYESLLYRKRLILSSTGSGKSAILYSLIRYFEFKGYNKGLVIVPDVALTKQLCGDFEEYSTINKWNSEDNIHLIYSGKDKNSDKFLYISTFQSLSSIKDTSYFEQFDFVICDEAHRAQSSSYNYIIPNCINAKYKLGFTGSLSGSKTHEKCLIGLLGPVIRVSKTKDLIDRNILSDLHIKCIILKYPEEEIKTIYKPAFYNKKKILKLKYEDEVKYIISNKFRNNFIKNLSLKLKGNTLILFQRVELHGKIIYELIKNSKYLKDRKVFFVHGKIDVDMRNEIRRIVESEKDAIIVASKGVFSTGINIINLHNIIDAFNNKSKINILQSIGRGLRRGNDKLNVNIYDLVDDLRFKGNNNYTMNHFLERIKYYNEEKFNYKLINYNLYKNKK